MGALFLSVNMPESDRTNRIAFYCLLGILIWAPLPFGSNVLWAEMLLCVMVFFVTLMVIGRGLFRPNRDPFNISHLGATFFWVIFALVSAQIFVALQLTPTIVAIDLGFNTIDPQATAVQLLLGIALCCVFFLVATTVQSRQDANLMLLTLVISGVFQASYGSIMTLSGLEYSFFLEKTAYLGAATGTFINRNHLAGYLVLTLACGIGLMIAGSNRREFRDSKDFFRSLVSATVSGKGALRVSLLVMVVGLVLTKSRMGNISFLVALSVSAALLLFTSKVPRKTIAIFITSIFVVDALIIGTFFDLDTLAKRLEQTTTQTENRDEILRLSLPLISDNLVVGTGAGTFYNSYPKYRDDSAGAGFYVHAHNDYLEFLSERGIMGTLPLIAFVVLCSLESNRLRKSRSMQKKGLAFTTTMSMIAIAFHSIVDFNLQVPGYSLTLTCVWALAFSQPFSTRPG